VGDEMRKSNIVLIGNLKNKKQGDTKALVEGWY